MEPPVSHLAATFSDVRIVGRVEAVPLAFPGDPAEYRQGLNRLRKHLG